MKSHFKKLLKGVIVSSMATLANTYGAEAMPTYRFSDNPPDDVSDEYDRSSKNESVKMLLHLNSDDTYTSVSYTHLDVYKRQGYVRDRSGFSTGRFGFR